VKNKQPARRREGRKPASDAAPKRRTVRERRHPDDARGLILAAAQKLLAERGPDAIGLLEVARAAGVSRGLVSHYFGTYDALVEAVFARHTDAVRAEFLRRMALGGNEGPHAWIEQLFAVISQPLYARLIGWAMLSRRFEREDFFSRRNKGMRQVADAIETLLRARSPDGRGRPREDIEFGLVLVLATAFGYSLGGSLLWAGLGLEPGDARDAGFRRRLATLIQEGLGR
jgi:AcrR family transcriptional regulator